MHHRGGKKRCGGCGKVKTTYRYDGFDLCQPCKGSMESCDHSNGSPYAGKPSPQKPNKSIARANSERLMRKYGKA